MRQVSAGALVCLFLLSGLGFAPQAYAQSTNIVCEPAGNVCRNTQTLLPLRILPRPNSLILVNADDNAAVVADDVAPFKPLYVFDRRDVDYSDTEHPKGWYQVGRTVTASEGWMRATDVMEWHQALIAAYTHTGVGEHKRPPVLMFDALNSLKAVTESMDPAMAARDIYDRVKKGDIPDGLVSQEPPTFLDIDQTFYVLPILDWRRTQVFEDPVVYMQMAAAVPGERAVTASEGTFADAQFVADAQRGDIADLSDAGVDVVFVMDMTSSMQPWMDAVRKAVANATRLMAENPRQGGVNRIRFGLIGYRDDVERSPGLEFLVKNFTPQPVDGDRIRELLSSEAKAAPVGSEEYTEDVYAGVLELAKFPWRDNAARVAFLIGDASPHQIGHSMNSTNMEATEVRSELNSARVYLSTIYLQASRARKDWPLAERSFRILGTNKDGKALFTAAPAADEESFERAMRDAVRGISSVLEMARQQGRVSTATSAGRLATAESGGALSGSSITSNAAQATEAALVQLIGRGAQAQRDLTFWAANRDLTDSRRESLNIRVLINRPQLNDIRMSLETIIKASAREEQLQMGFFEALQSVTVETQIGREVNLASAKRLVDSGLVPRWIDALPYKSDIASMKPQDFEALTPDQRHDLEKRLEGLIGLYANILENRDRWVSLAENASADDIVVPLALTDLP